MNRQLRLFDLEGASLLWKLLQEGRESKKVSYHWNGEKW